MPTSEEAAWSDFLARLAIRRPRELVLIQPALVPRTLFDPVTARRGGYYNFPPVGLLYLAAAAKAALPELRVELVDLNHELLRASRAEDFDYERVWSERVRDVLAGCQAPHVGISFMFGTTKPCFEEVARFVRGQRPDATILVGGVQATFDFQRILSEGPDGLPTADIVFRREGELQLQQYLRACAGEREDTLPVGAAVLHEGQVVEMGKPLEDVPMDWDIRPFYDLLRPIEEYSAHGCLGAFSHYVGRGKSYATVLGNRGCRARCTFCTVRNFNGFGIRQRSVQNVVDEVKFLVEERGVRHIDWLDDDLLWDPQRTVALFKALAEQVPGLEWTASNGLIAVAIEDEVMEWMVRSGLKAFKIGIESGNDRMLRQIKKPTTKPKLRERRALFARYPDVFVSANFIIGFPGESFEQMLDSFDFARELEWDWSSFYICQPLKGTEMFDAFSQLGDDRCREEGYSKTINPGRAAERGEFGYKFTRRESLRTGWAVFDLPLDATPDLEQQKEIWFAFNLVANFLDNPCLRPGSDPRVVSKVVRWLEAIHAGYPYDASMTAALAHAYGVLGDAEQARVRREKFLELTAQSDYWQGRVHQFPELLRLAGVEERPAWFKGELTAGLIRALPARPRRLPSSSPPAQVG